jgi:DNA-binding MarR family transcriptional regulator
MRTINTDLIEKIILVNEKLLKFSRENIFKNTDLTPSQFNILWEIIAHNWLWVNKIKEKLIISSPALSQLLNRMEKQELIERKLWKIDKREIKITATKKAISLYNELNKKYISLADNKLSFLNEADKENMLKLLENIEKTIK